ncbi:MAG: flagellar filament capping protein FliD [Alcaligenaceae bacterium]|nr:flagellar filament capping protein FliD [Alcaligenaceae bacterium]
MATVSSLGVGSNLPLNDLLTNLRNNENNALAIIQNRQVAAQTRLSAYGKLQGAVSALQTAAENVAKADAFGALKASSSSEVLSASVDTDAIPGQYSIQVDSLARAQTLVAAGRTDRTTAIGSAGALTITLADGSAHTLDMTGQDTSLNGLVAAINADPDIGVNATLVNDGSDTPYRLLLTARQTGEDAAIAKIEVAGNQDLQDFIGYDKAGSTANFSEQAATNAQLSINGIAISSQTNSIHDAIDGVELTLTDITDTPAMLSVTRDNSVASKAITDFVSAYNSLQDTLKSLTSYDIDNQQSSALTGDSLARRVQSELRSPLNSAVGGPDTLTLSMIGITTDPASGKLDIDDTKLSEALNTDLRGVTAMFSGKTGVGAMMVDSAEKFTATGGLFSSTTDSLNRTISSIQDQYDAAAARIDQRMETYRQQFTRLDAMVAQMNGISSYLTQQLSMLNSTSQS